MSTMFADQARPDRGSETPADSPQSLNLRLLTYSAAAALLGVGYHKIQRAARRGLISTYSIGDSKKYVREVDLKAFLERVQRVAPLTEEDKRHG